MQKTRSLRFFSQFLLLILLIGIFTTMIGYTHCMKIFGGKKILHMLKNIRF